MTAYVPGGSPTPIGPLTANAQFKKVISPPADPCAKLGYELEVLVVHKGTCAPIDFPLHQKLLRDLAQALVAQGRVFRADEEKAPDTGLPILTRLVGVRDQKGSTYIGEPGNQIEAALKPYKSAVDVARETDKFLELLTEIAQRHGCAVTIPGQYPLDPANLTSSGRPRYRAFEARFAAIADGLGLVMTQGSCASQINLDLPSDSERWNMAVRTATLIQPVLVALFANSSVLNSHATPDVHSNRSEMWRTKWGLNTTAFAELVARSDFSIDQYIDWVRQQRIYILPTNTGDISFPGGVTLNELIDPSRRPESMSVFTEADLANVLSTVVGQVKMKPGGVIELRGPDASYELRHALPALAAGIFYHRPSLETAHTLVSSWSTDERTFLIENASGRGLDIPFKDGTIRDIALQLCTFAHKGLVARGLGEEDYLEPLMHIARGEQPTPAANTLALMCEQGLSAEGAFRLSFVPHVSASDTSVRSVLRQATITLAP